jgi:fatty acid desaturase
MVATTQHSPTNLISQMLQWVAGNNASRITYHALRIMPHASFSVSRFTIYVPCFRMSLNATARRRWFGALVLFAAVVMLVVGESVLKEQLHGYAFLFYWLVCLSLTFIAILVALADARALQRRIYDENRELFKSTLKDIDANPKDQRGSRQQGR